MSQEKIIEVDDLYFRYNTEEEMENEESWALEAVNLEVYAGEWLAVTGHNGSGKSTLAKCLNGLLLPVKGNVRVNGAEPTNEEALWEIRRAVGMVFQNPDNQFVGTSVRDDVAFGMENHGIPREKMIVRLQEALQLVDMSDYADQEPHRLSGGQKQRVAIAGIIALEPSIIVLDEATSMLDPQGRHDVLKIIRNLNKEKGITVISITHDLEEASDADRMIVMDQGKVVREGDPRHIFYDPEGLQAIGLDLPFSVKMRQTLIKKGLPLSQDAFIQTELVDELWKLRSRV